MRPFLVPRNQEASAWGFKQQKGSESWSCGSDCMAQIPVSKQTHWLILVQCKGLATLSQKWTGQCQVVNQYWAVGLRSWAIYGSLVLEQPCPFLGVGQLGYQCGSKFTPELCICLHVGYIYVCMFIGDLSVYACVYVYINMHADAVIQTKVCFLKCYLLDLWDANAMKLGS